jgi:hypothetical protein
MHSLWYRNRIRAAEKNLSGELEDAEEPNDSDQSGESSQSGANTSQRATASQTLSHYVDSIKDVKPSTFAQFVSWMYTGKFLDDDNGVLSQSSKGEVLYGLARNLEAPTFSNFCMDDTRRDYRKDKKHWVTPESLNSAYEHAGAAEGTLFRKLIADVVNCENPFRKLKKESLYSGKNGMAYATRSQRSKLIQKHRSTQDGRRILLGILSTDGTIWK